MSSTGEPGSPSMTATTASPAMMRADSPSSQDHTETTVRIGMSDVDAYGFLYYATYIKYNERMANLISPAHALAVCGVQMMKFIRSVTWGSEITIATFLCPPAHGSDDPRAEAAGEEQLRLIHAWYDTEEVGARPTGDSPKQTPLTPHNISICSYKMPTSAAAREAVMGRFCTPPKSHPLFRQLLVCVREALTPVPPLPPVCAPLRPSRQRELCITILPDAIGYGGRLAPSVALDLFERARTAIIGGQPNLAWLKEEGVAVVVYRLREMLLPPTPVPLGGRVTSVSSEASEIAPRSRRRRAEIAARRGLARRASPLRCPPVIRDR